jgi:hypothetical protein
MGPVLGLSVEHLLSSGWLDSPPAWKHAVGLWIGATVLGLLGSAVVDWIGPSRAHPVRSPALPGAEYVYRNRPSRLYERLVPGIPEGYARATVDIQRLDDLGRHWDLVALLALDTVAEELVFRGLPLALAVAAGISPALPVAVGTLLWVLLHTELPGTLLTGAILAWLWIVGAWPLAIAIHLGNNVTAHLIARCSQWITRRRYQDWNSSRAGKTR